MEDKSNNSLNISLVGDKGTVKDSQLKIIHEYLQDYTATASMVSDATGIPQKNICRFKRSLERDGRLWEIEKKLCERTGFKAWYLSTNPDLAPAYLNQLKLF